MPVARRCSFCGGHVEPGTGLMLVKRDGMVTFFCSSKCERYTKLGRKPHRVRWTERFRRAKTKA